jgi:hypothetical protein
MMLRTQILVFAGPQSELDAAIERGDLSQVADRTTVLEVETVGERRLEPDFDRAILDMQLSDVIAELDSYIEQLEAEQEQDERDEQLAQAQRRIETLERELVQMKTAWRAAWKVWREAAVGAGQ